MIPEFWDELPEIIQDIDHNARARVIVISSTGPHFSSGLDLKAFITGSGQEREGTVTQEQSHRQYSARFYSQILLMQQTFSCLEGCRIPVIAAIQGGAIGGGVDFATACDIRYATEDAFFTIFEINIGMTADVGTFPRLVKLIPEGVVRELAYTGRRMPAREAKAVGLVNQVFPDQDRMLEEVMKIAREIADKAPLAVYGCKRMINYSRDHGTIDGLDYIGIWNAGMLQPEAMLEAVTANAENRPGNFADLPVIPKTIKKR
jgi:enoyl-CoA hydratase